MYMNRMIRLHDSASYLCKWKYVYMRRNSNRPFKLFIKKESQKLTLQQNIRLSTA